MKIMILKILPY